MALALEVQPHQADRNGQPISLPRELTRDRHAKAGDAELTGQPDPVERALRHRHGRGDGLRHPSGRPAQRLGPELVDDAITDGITGFRCDRPSELAWAIMRSDEIEPKLCRQHVANNFDVATIAAKYEAIYRTASAARAQPPAATSPAPRHA